MKRSLVSNSSHRSSKISSRGRRATFECLEDRRVLAVDFASTFSVGGAATVFDLALDGAGNTCVVGYCSGTTDFDPGPATYQLTSGGTFAAKYDPSGALLWAQRVGAGNSAFNFGPEIAAGVDGSVYIVGTFENSRTFGSTTLISAGDDDAYVIKLDANGDFAWANRFGGAGADWGNDVAVDPAGNVYVMAETRDTGNPDAFIAKMDAAGNVLWSTEIGASSSTTTKGRNTTTTGWARGFKLAVDNAGGVYATGRMSGTVDFDASPGTTKLSGDAFVAKLSAIGTLVWARTFDASLAIEPHDIAVDLNGNVYSTGLYNLTVDFDPGTAKSQKFILDAGTDQNGAWITATYVSALNSSGNFLWATSSQKVGGLPYRAAPDAIAVDSAGDIYIAGEFSGTADFDPGAGAFSLTSAGNVDAFVWKLDTSGNFVWAGQLGGTTADRATGIGVDVAGNIFVGGSFTGTADFDPGPGTYNLTSAGDADFFVAKLVQNALVPALGAYSDSDASTGPSTSVGLAEKEIRSFRHTVLDSAFADFEPKLLDLLLLME